MSAVNLIAVGQLGHSARQSAFGIYRTRQWFFVCWHSGCRQE